MFKAKLKFNHKSLRFERVPFNLKRLLMLLIPHSFVSLLTAAAFLTIYMVFFETPEEQLLRAENKYLKKNYKEISNKFADINAKLGDMAVRDNELYRTVFQLDSIPLAMRNAGYGGRDRYAALEGFASSGVVIDVATKIDILAKKLEVQTQSYAEIAELAMQRSRRLRSVPVMNPIHNNSLNHIGSYYGYRRHPIFNTIQMHHGVDIVAASGTPIHASGDGKVVRIEKNNSRSGYGNLVVIDHGINGLTSCYAHLKTIEVTRGQSVKRGQKIGTVGSTGLSTAPHLHFEIRVNGTSVDPMKYLVGVTPKQYDELLQMSKIEGGVAFD